MIKTNFNFTTLPIYSSQTEMKSLIQNSKTRAIHITTIDWALDLVNDWENELFVDSKENDELVAFVTNEMERFRSERNHHNKVYQMKFPERLMLKICNSKVFMYTELLPKVPFNDEQLKINHFIPAEEQ